MTAQEKIRNRKVGVLGMARSGMAVARLSKKLGGQPFVSDAGPASALAARVSELRALDIPCETDHHSDKLLATDYLVLSPGVSLDIDILSRVRAKGIPIFSEIEFASWLCRGKIVAITGSNGKTTTTTLMGEICAAAGLDTHVCGNIGVAFADVVEKVSEKSVVVLEVSSFQLETIGDFRPHIGAILNITPDHLDRHGTFGAYRKAKLRIAENQSSEQYLVMNREDRESASISPDTQAELKWFSTSERAGENATWVTGGSLWLEHLGKEVQVIATRDILIPGPHNLQNAAAAALMASLLGIDPAIIARVLKSFPGVEHRIERCGTVAGVNFINDSKATNVDSVVQALRSIETPIYLILGGRDKGGSYNPIAQVGKDKIRGIIVIGEARDKIFAALGRTFPMQFAASLEEAVERGFALASPGDTVMLSPACASFDMFDNFEHRGRVFKATVASLKNGRKKNETVSG
jgi:UDP-N-acetylmuramoylalanine--D-glutamate ligase